MDVQREHKPTGTEWDSAMDSAIQPWEEQNCNEDVLRNIAGYQAGFSVGMHMGSKMGMFMGYNQRRSTRF